MEGKGCRRTIESKKCQEKGLNFWSGVKGHLGRESCKSVQKNEKQYRG